MTANALEGSRRAFFSDGSAFAPVQRAEIVGIEPILERVDRFIDALRRSEALERYGARLEAGVLFEGPPGTGKTLVARYVATVSGALFVDARAFPREQSELHAQDVADLFRRAREAYGHGRRPVVIFWDEFDDHARWQPDGPLSERSIVSQLKAELDGVVGKNIGIVMVTCTNNAASIDRTLLRPGRIGTRLRFTPPDLDGKARLLDRYLGVVSTAGPIDTHSLAHLLGSNAPASAAEEAVAEAWRLAVVSSLAAGQEPCLMQQELQAALLERLLGEPSGMLNVTPAARWRTAVHETGHALVALDAGLPVALITVRPSVEAAGRMLLGDYQETHTLAEQKALLRVAYGGMLAEELLGLDGGVGNGGDTARMTYTARGLVEANDIGVRSGAFQPLAGGPRGGRPVSEELLGRIDLDVLDLLEQAREDARGVLRRIGADTVQRLAEALLRDETLLGPEIVRLSNSELCVDRGERAA